MSKRNSKAFTLIELIGVLVIMAIIALIVTPLVMNIIRKARVSADKRSIDAYGRSIELAIAGYLMDNGSFPTDINQLKIEYSGDEVVCITTNLNSDSTVYLAGCTVGGRNVEGYTYGKEESVPTPSYTAYSVGDEVSYNNINYYVIKESDTKDSTVTLLKATPLTTEEVNLYGGVGTNENVVNKYTYDDSGFNLLSSAIDNNGYGTIAYYDSESCYHKGRGNFENSGCKNDYQLSSIKKVVDSWVNTNVPNGMHEARLITYNELVNNLGYTFEKVCTADCYQNTLIDNVPSWAYSTNYSYWTMSTYDDSNLYVWFAGKNVNGASVNSPVYAVRPVIVLDKSVLTSS